jgi:hypothetical protein
VPRAMTSSTSNGAGAGLIYERLFEIAEVLQVPAGHCWAGSAATNSDDPALAEPDRPETAGDGVICVPGKPTFRCGPPNPVRPLFVVCGSCH